jgi:murein endopeptidase
VGTDTLVAWLQGVLRNFRARYPAAPRIGIGDLSLPRGGPFGADYGGLGHASHQNGLDVDVLYPRRDRAERAPERPADVDRALSQALVDTFVRAGARFCFVGQHVGLRGPRAIVQAIPHHDDHVHVRITPL